MRKLTYGMNVSLDGFVAAPGGDLSWSVPSDELFQWWSDRVAATSLSLYGRGLWETMSEYWPTADDQPGITPAEVEFARRWREMPKVVFSSTLTAVDWNARLVTTDAVTEIARLKAQDGEPMDIGGATLAAFGATRRAGSTADADPLVRALLDSGASVVTLVAKSHARHVEQALRTTLQENLAMIRDTVTFLRGEGRRVFLDAEHFFDGYRLDRAYALECVRAAAESGAEVVALCDTNGGMLPAQVADVVRDVLDATGARVGIHCHNDTGCAVANSMAAVDAGATHVQGTVNGYGERTGNANILTLVSNLQIKQGMPLLEPARLREATRISHAISEVTNVPPYSRQPYVGASAFAHKAGLHASALKVDPDLYQHTCLLYTSPSPRDGLLSRMPSSA